MVHDGATMVDIPQKDDQHSICTFISEVVSTSSQVKPPQHNSANPRFAIDRVEDLLKQRAVTRDPGRIYADDRRLLRPYSARTVT